MHARVTLVVLVVVFLATAALAQDPPSGPATFCLQQYALCIKAPCRPIVTRNSDGTYVQKVPLVSITILARFSAGGSSSVFPFVASASRVSSPGDSAQARSTP